MLLGRIFPAISPIAFCDERANASISSKYKAYAEMRVTSGTYETKKVPSYNTLCNTNSLVVTLIYYICYRIPTPLQKSKRPDVL